MANPLGSCVSSLRSTNALLSSSISILDSGVNDFPRLAKVLQTTRVCSPSLHSSNHLLPFEFALNSMAGRFKSWHEESTVLINTTHPAFRTPPRTHPPIRPIRPPRLPHPRSRLPPLQSRVPPRQTRPPRTSPHRAQRAARRPDRRRGTRIRGPEEQRGGYYYYYYYYERRRRQQGGVEAEAVAGEEGEVGVCG